MSDPAKVTHWVVYCFERYQDGSDEFAKVFSNLERAVEQASKWAFSSHSNPDVRLFELGREILLREEVIEEPQPSIKKRRYVL